MRNFLIIPILFIFLVSCSNSEKKINQDHLYLADIDLNPFYANLDINLNSIKSLQGYK